MKLRELMDQFFDETWFAVTTPDGKEHMFFNADYIGGDPDVMSELGPLLDRDFSNDVIVEMHDNPYGERYSPVLAVCVGLLMSDEERSKQ